VITPVVLPWGRTHGAHFRFEGKSSSTSEQRLGSIKLLPGRYSLDFDLPLLLTGVVLYGMEVGACGRP